MIKNIAHKSDTSVVLRHFSPSLKLKNLTPRLTIFHLKTLLGEKTVTVELGESQCRMIPQLEFAIFGLKILKNDRD